MMRMENKVSIAKSNKGSVPVAKCIAKRKNGGVPIAQRKKGGSAPIAKRKKAPVGNQTDMQKSGRARLELAGKLHKREQSLDLKRWLRTKEEVWKKLTPCQRAAMSHVDSLAKSLHSKALPALQKRVLRLGFTKTDLEKSLLYIRDDAPIVVHLSAETLALLCKDPWYRSQFETGTSKGINDRARRQNWENIMFAKAYASVRDSEHPKYGCLNITGDIRGVRGARRYGELFMTLAPDVRHRTSFSNAGTGHLKGQGKVATNAWFGP